MSIPYSYNIYNKEDTEHPVKEVKGIISFSDGEILFEFKVYNAQGSSISSLNKFSVALDLIHKIYFKKGFLRNKLIIESKRLAFLDPLPGSSQGRIELLIKKADRDEAIRFSTKLNLYLSQLLEDKDEEKD